MCGACGAPTFRRRHVRLRTRINDLARPRYPWPLRASNFALRPLARSLFRLDSDSLIAAAAKSAALDDFGDPAFREPLDVLVASLEKEARLSPVGRFLSRRFLVQLLVNRLRIEDLFRRHPEIEDEEIEAPVFILGLPRTGTTYLHGLMSAHPAFRSLPYWESIEPIPPPGENPDRRIERAERALRFQHYVMPLFPVMHEMTADAPHEEIQLLAMTFSTMLFEASYRAPSYRDWYKSRDQRPAYRYLRRVLKALQWLRGPRRWLLKSPQHLEQLRPLIDVFPDARIVQTHRDPVRAVASMCTMVAYGLRMNSDRIDPREVGVYWRDRISDLLQAGITDRHVVPRSQMAHVRFDELTAEPWSAVERVLDLTGEPLTPSARDAIAAHMDANPRGKHGRIRYRLDEFGLDEKSCRERLGFYQKHYGIPAEQQGN